MASEGEVESGPGTQVTSSNSLTVSDQPDTSHSTEDRLLPHQVQTSLAQPFQGLRQRNDNKPSVQIVSDAPSFNTNGKSSGNHSKGIQEGMYGGTADDGSTTWTESTTVPRRNLGFLQITSLMINTTIGGGIFNTPGYVLALTRSKTISMVLWAVGGVYTSLSMLVFLEFGTALPFNGGALIYLDEVFHRPKLLATVTFSCFWILLAGTISSSKVVAQNLLSLANPDMSTSDIPDGQIRFTAVVVQTVVCLLLFFARRWCFLLNTTFAFYKVILLLVIFIAGMQASGERGNVGFQDFDREYSGYNGVDALTAMIYIIFSYQGWDNANYIAGEIRDYKKTLRNASIATCATLTCLYMLATLGFFAVADYATLTNDDGQNSSALQFAELVFGSSTGMKVAITLSVFSDQIFVTYTTAKVKQAIAWQRIIPFHKFFGRQDPYFDSPGGALFLHWLFTILPIACFNQRSDARAFFAGLYSYGYQIMLLFLGIGLLRLKSKMRLLHPEWNLSYLRNPILLYLISFIFFAANIVMLVMTALPHDAGTTPRFYWPITVIGSIGFGLVYWGVLRSLQIPGLGRQDEGAVEMEGGTDGRTQNERDRGRTLGKWIGVEVTVYEGNEEVPDDMKFLMYEAGLDGSRRRVSYAISGPAEKCKKWYSKAHGWVFKHLGYE